MTANRRIFLNIIATYGRSLYALAIGLITARWALEALGQVDYGLLGVVGGLTAFISFFNGILSSAIGRFYAYSVGAAQVCNIKSDGLEECRHWFSVAIIIHSAVPAILIVVGYPFGIWAVKNFLTIPIDRINDCVWVFRFVCVTCWVGMVNVPFAAMYGAKQYIAELTIYSFITTTLNAFFLYLMIKHPGIWLVRYSLWSCILAVVPQLIICVRALFVFPECRFRIKYCANITYYKRIVSYAGWQFFGSLGTLVRGQGMAILVNKYFGPIFNTTAAIANSVASHSETLANSLYGAFSPAITQAAGAGDKDLMLSMSYRACKLGTILCLLFAIPLGLEIDYVLKLWLKNPPDMLGGATLLLLVYLLLGQIVRGVDLAIIAEGSSVGEFMFRVGGYMMLTLPVAWAIIHFLNVSFLWIFGVMVLFRVFVSFITMPIARRSTGFSPRHWVFKIFLPVLLISALSLLAGRIIVCFFDESIFRVLTVSVITFLTTVFASWFFALSREEKGYVIGRFQKIKERMSL